MPLRYLDADKQYGLYDWIDVPAARSRKDPRPESYKIDSDRIVVAGHVSTDRGTWRTRRELICGNPTWQFNSVGELKREEVRSKRSMGVVTPGAIVDVRLIRKSAAARVQFERKLSAIQSQGDMFLAEYKALEYLEFDVQLHWRCAERCPECSRGPHQMKVLDWGLLELGRREGWPKAQAKLEEISNLRTHDFRLYLGNFRLRPKTFGIIGLWYPKRRTQLELL